MEDAIQKAIDYLKTIDCNNQANLEALIIIEQILIDYYDVLIADKND